MCVRSTNTAQAYNEMTSWLQYTIMPRIDNWRTPRRRNTKIKSLGVYQKVTRSPRNDEYSFWWFQSQEVKGVHMENPRAPQPVLCVGGVIRSHMIGCRMNIILDSEKAKAEWCVIGDMKVQILHCRQFLYRCVAVWHSIVDILWPGQKALLLIYQARNHEPV